MRKRSTARSTTAGAVLAELDRIAPFAHAEEWDNVGLLVGRPEWRASRALLAIDLTDDVAREALRKKADLLVLYHPPIFKGIKTVTPNAAAPTTLLPDLLAARTSLIALHTALDVAPGGTNDVLLNAFDITERHPLETELTENAQYKLVVIVPPAEVGGLRTALSAAGAGVIGHYTECSYTLEGRGSFRGDETTTPTIGRKQVLEYVDETRLEMVVPRARLGEVVRVLYHTHSYEEPAFDVYPLHEVSGRGAVGKGRVGVLRKRQRGIALLRQLSTIVDLRGASVVCDLKRTFESVTVAAGAYGVRSFRDPSSLVVTGEFKHHDALELERRGVTAIHLGHYASERPVLEVLLRRLRRALHGVKLEVARSGHDPYQPCPK